MKTIIKVETKTCAPCKAIAPLFKSLSEKYKDTITTKVFDAVDDAENIQRFRIKSVPTFLALIDGKLVNQIIGNVSDQVLEDMFIQLDNENETLKESFHTT